MVNYKNSLIYKIYCKDENIKECYIGSTTNFQRRKSRHKSYCKTMNNTAKLYNFINSNGGLNNFEFEIVAHVPCMTKKELLKIEAEYILKNKYSLNMLVPGRTRAESDKAYRENNKEKIKIRKKNYYLRNREKISLKRKILYKNRKSKKI